MSTAMQTAYQYGWKPKGARPRDFRWVHPKHGTLCGSGPGRVTAPWVHRTPDGHEKYYASMTLALEAIHRPPGDEVEQLARRLWIIQHGPRREPSPEAWEVYLARARARLARNAIANPCHPGEPYGFDADTDAPVCGGCGAELGVGP